MATRFTKVFDSRDYENTGLLDEMIYDWAPGTYATNGQKFDLDAALSEASAADAGLAYEGTILGVQKFDHIADKGYEALYDSANSKMKILDEAGTEVVNATDLDAAGVVFRFRIVGQHTAASEYAS